LLHQLLCWGASFMKNRILGVLMAGAVLPVMLVAGQASAADDGSSIAKTTAASAAAVDDTIVVTKGRADIAVFGKRPFMRDPVLSPDGNKVAVMMSKNGVDSLGYIDVTKPGSAPVFFAQAEEYREAGDRTMGSWRWVGNRTIVMSVASREIFFGQRGDVVRLVAYDLETKKLTPLAWDGAGGNGGSIKFVDDENEKILIEHTSMKNSGQENLPEIVEVDVRTGKIKVIMRPNIAADGGWIVGGGRFR
jgi:hypothetical protein